MNAPTRLAVPSVSLAHLTDPDEAARIERFVTQQGGSVFHRPLWLRAIELGTGQQAMGLVSEQAGQLTGWLPLTLVHSPLFGRALVSCSGMLPRKDNGCLVYEDVDPAVGNAVLRRMQGEMGDVKFNTH